MIYTIGYQCITPDDLCKTVLALDAKLIDCRFRPISRKAGFGFRQLEAMLPGRYVTAGGQLGGMGHTTASGIANLRKYDGEDAPNVILMCMEHHPADCHRHQAITGPNFPDAMHIWEGHVLRSGDLQDAADGHRTYDSIELFEL